MTTFQVDDLEFELRLSRRRKTLEVTVDRGGELLLAAPPDVDDDTLRAFVREKRYWIYRKLTEKAELRRSVPHKEFVNGEGFLYLGRSYRLKLVDRQEVPLKLAGGHFLLRRDEREHARDRFIAWYGERGRDWLALRVAEYAGRMETQPAGIKIQELGYRWGSCGKGGWLYFHWKSMMLPRGIAEYVVVHELAHLHEPHHTPAFWRRVERAMPDFERRQAWLAERGITVEGL